MQSMEIDRISNKINFWKFTSLDLFSNLKIRDIHNLGNHKKYGVFAIFLMIV
jgi:hypothetical protein